jgi:hypothetical protein
MWRLIHNIDVRACPTVDQKYRSSLRGRDWLRLPKKPDVFALEDVSAFEQDPLTRA